MIPTTFPRQLAALALACAALPVLADTPAKAADGLLVAANGMTLYTFDKDAAGSGKSACNGPCPALWPPLKAEPGAKAEAPYSLVTREDGAQQWAYKGKPLYFYKEDEKAGERKGDNFKSLWHVVKE